MTHLPPVHGLPGLSALVVGLARSGAGAAGLLRRHGFAVRVVDRKTEEELGPLPGRMRSLGAELMLGGEAAGAPAGMDFVVLSPGVPAASLWVREAEQLGLPVLGELEVAARFSRAPYVAVTGTNGKTTTSTWLAHLLRRAGRESLLAGNVGEAFSEEADHLGEGAIAVLEASSFQLEHIETFRPRAAAVLNVTPDHLDRYPSMREYAAAKARVFENQAGDDLAVLNESDPGSRSMEGSVRARLAWFHPGRAVEHGAGVERGRIVLYREGNPIDLIAAGELALPGPHNLENALAALALSLPWELDPERLRRGLMDFPAIAHRLEPCGEVRGVKFVNDSKATNLDSMEKALRSFKVPIHLVAGGRDKGADWPSLAGLAREQVRSLLLIGEAAGTIARAWADIESVRCAGLSEAVAEGLARARPGEVVLLSPGCASFDMFRSYEDRGDQFRAAVARLPKG